MANLVTAKGRQAHHLFSVNETCKGIVDAVADSYDFDREETYKPLLKLALVSKTFSVLALYELWRDLENVRPLVGLLPSNAFSLTAAGFVVSFPVGHILGTLIELLPQVLTRPLIASDFAVFDQYAPHVKSLQVTTAFDCEHLSRLCEWRNPLLPCLRRVEWRTTLSPSAIIPLLCPSVEMLLLDITSDGSKEVYNTFLRNLPSFMPDLRLLHTVGHVPSTCTESLSKTIGQLPAFESFYCPVDLNHDALVHLSASPRLHALRFGAISDDICASLNTPGFPILETLGISKGTKASNLSSLLRSITSTRLHTLRLVIQDRGADISSILNAIGTFTSLLRLSLVAQSPLSRYVSALDALHTCHRLEKIDLFFVDGFLHDEHIDAMAKSWPHLRWFTLYQGSARPIITIESLLVFAENCPSLDHLRISVDAFARVPYTTPRVPRRGGGLSQLWDLELPQSPCGPAGHVAEFLNYAFPRLVTLRANEWRPVEDTRGWDEVRSMLANLLPIV